MSAGTFSAIGNVSASVAIDQDDGLTITLTNTGGNLWTVVLEESIGNASWRLMATYSSDQSATVVTPRLGRMMIVRLRAATILTGDTIAYTVTRVSNQDGVTLTLEDGVPTDPSLALTTDLPSQLYRTVVKSFNNTEIKAIPSTPLELLAEPGVGFAYGLIAVMSVLNTTAGAYTNKTNASPQVTASTAVTAVQACVGLLGSAGVYIDQWPIGESSIMAGDFDGYVTTTARTITGNKSLTLADAWNGSDYTGGHASNTLKMTLVYFVVDIATGALVPE